MASSTPQPLPARLPASGVLSGFVLDSKGNKVPGAYAILYVENNTAPIAGNPTYTSSDPSDYGEYHFTGLPPGNYTIHVEKADVYVFNGTASLVIRADAIAQIDVTLTGYVFKPYITPTPVPEPPTVEPIVMPTAAPTAVPTAVPVNEDIINKVKDNALGPVIIVLIVGIGGAGFMTLRGRKKSRKKVPGAPETKTPNVIQKADVEAASRKVNVNGTSQASRTSPEYIKEIEELAQMSMAGGYVDIAVLNKVNALSKKFGVDQSTVFLDINKVRGVKGKR